MAMAMCIGTDIPRDWLQSGETVRICGQDFRPKSSGHLAGAPLCIQKGQATVVFLEQVPQGHTWLLKLFTPGRWPTDAYLLGVEKCLPGTVACFACTQRRLLTREHLDVRASSYKNPALADWVSGGVMMPKVPGTSWASVAEDLRDGAVQMSLSERLRLSLALARIIDILEAAQCSHRDLSGTNVFVDEQGRIWLIDFDCLYHPSLPFQANTTVGTMGYVAPFLKVTGGSPDAALSWRPYADRFSLAVLVAEILITGPDLAPPHEDGTLFSQSQIDEPGNRFVREMIGRLKGLSKPCGLLLERAFGSLTFEACPSPQEWIRALRRALRGVQAGQATGSQGDGKRRFVWVLCAQCGSAFSIARAKHDELRQKGKSILCRRCLSSQFTESSVARAQHRLDFPEVSCEHCGKTFSLPRITVDSLRHRGRPILCPECLPSQLEKWRAEQAEYDRSHPLVACAICGKGFRLRKERLDQLTSQGKAVLCSACLSESREKRLAVKNEPFTKTTVHNLKPWHL
jgi:DNA-directed RNA polymerase subunit RPC12/RpoP